jgi:hypothetical protein
VCGSGSWWWWRVVWTRLPILRVPARVRTADSAIAMSGRRGLIKGGMGRRLPH